MLNLKYFKKLYSEGEYIGYQPIGSPIILFSEIDGTPLAALHFNPSAGVGAKVDDVIQSIICDRPSMSDSNIQYFQGLINTNEQEFEFVISNLSDKGNINFNIMKTDDKVVSVNPLGLNEINELRPNESYAVRCDQQNNLALILNTIKDKVTKKTISLKEDEEKAKETKQKAKGTYFYLSIVPQLGKEYLCKRYEKTVWKTVDCFVVKREKPKFVPYSSSAQTNTRFGSSRNVVPMNTRFGSSRNAAQTNTRFGSSRNVAPMNTLFGSSRNASHNTLSPSMNTIFDISPWSRADPESSNDFFNGQVSQMEHEEYPEEGEEDGDGGYDLFGDVEDDIEEAEIVKSSIAVKVKEKMKEKFVMESSIAEISGGSKVVVNSVASGIEYDYNRMARKCVVGLSVNENLEFINVDTEFVDEIKEQIAQFNLGKYDEFLKSKIYEAEECVICLEDGVDTVLYQCAHKCGHYACIEKVNKCPVCRGHIKAKIRIKPTKSNIEPVIELAVAN